MVASILITLRTMIPPRLCCATVILQFPCFAHPIFFFALSFVTSDGDYDQELRSRGAVTQKRNLVNKWYLSTKYRDEGDPALKQGAVGGKWVDVYTAQC